MSIDIEWHRVGDRLPEHANCVLVYAASYRNPFGVARRSGPGWRSEGVLGQDITDWRELPPGPTGDGNV